MINLIKIMAENKVMDKIQRDLIKKYHTLAGQLGMTSKDKRSLLSVYDVESSRDLSQHQLIDVIATLSRMIEKKHGKESMDTLRKRVIRSIFAYYEVIGKKVTMEYVIGTACRSAKIENFNKIPREKLRSLYGAYLNQRKTIISVQNMHNTLIDLNRK